MDQQKKNIALIVSLGVLAMISFLLMVSGSVSESVIDPTLFKLTDPTSVNRVLIEKSNSKIDLSFNGGSWRVNDSLEADRNLIDVLFATVDQAVPKRSVALRMRDSLQSQINSVGIKISFFSGDKIQKQFIVLGVESSGLTYFSDAQEKNPYVMIIPGYRVQVSGIFEQPTNAWRDKRIFNFSWRNFKELTAQFPRDPKQNFTVAMTGRYFSIVGESRIDTASLNNYLDAVSLINADQFYEAGQSLYLDSLTSSTPIMSIQVKDVSDKIYSLNLFEIGQHQRYALCQWDNDYVLFDRRNILQIYKKKKDFVK